MHAPEPASAARRSLGLGHTPCWTARQAHLPGVCCCSVAQSYPTLSDPLDGSPPDFSVLHHLQELAQTHINWVGDAIQPAHLLLLLLLLPSVFPSIRVFSSEWPWCVGPDIEMDSDASTHVRILDAGCPHLQHRWWFQGTLSDCTALRGFPLCGQDWDVVSWVGSDSFYSSGD